MIVPCRPASTNAASKDNRPAMASNAMRKTPSGATHESKRPDRHRCSAPPTRPDRSRVQHVISQVDSSPAARMPNLDRAGGGVFPESSDTTIARFLAVVNRCVLPECCVLLSGPARVAMRLNGCLTRHKAKCDRRRFVWADLDRRHKIGCCSGVHPELPSRSSLSRNGLPHADCRLPRLRMTLPQVWPLVHCLARSAAACPEDLCRANGGTVQAPAHGRICSRRHRSCHSTTSSNAISAILPRR